MIEGGGAMNKVEMLREQLGLTRAELARKAEINYMTLWLIEREPDYKTSYETADKICSVLEQPLETVFPEFERKSPYPAKT